MRKTLLILKPVIFSVGFVLITLTAFPADAFSQETVAPFLIAGKLQVETPYKDAAEFTKWYFDSTYYEMVRLQKDFECLRIYYPSDTASVEAWLYKPVMTEKRHFPVILYNRGGSGNYGALNEGDLVNFYKLASSGYVVLATNYRFAGVIGKYDQWGGSDLNDVLNLENVFRNLPYADTANIFMFGNSRGGQMTYMAAKTMRLNAAAVTAGVTNWQFDMKSRPEFIEGWHDENEPEMDFLGLRHTLPDFDLHAEEYLRARSATEWADSIRCPVLILHSRQDTRVICNHALRLAQQLQHHGKEYQLIIYDEESHSLPFRYFDSFNQILSWFERHKKP